MPKITDELPVLFFPDQASFEDWLERQRGTSAGIRLQIAKKDSGVDSVTYPEALESAICYGWIDSRKEKWDDKFWLQRFTPRGARSIWSKVNRAKAEQLMADGRMKPAGISAVEEAKRNGQWDKAYDSQSTSAVPEDFAFELERSSKAKAFFETLGSQNRYAILFRIGSAKKAETRAKRIRQFIAMLEKGEKLYPNAK